MASRTRVSFSFPTDCFDYFVVTREAKVSKVSFSASFRASLRRKVPIADQDFGCGIYSRIRTVGLVTIYLENKEVSQ